MRYSSTNTRRGIGLSLLLLILVAGCDTTGGEETAVYDSEIEVVFRFSGSEEQEGTPFAVEAEAMTVEVDGNVISVNSLAEAVEVYLDELADFDRSDLTRAELVEVELVPAFPLRVNWDFLQEAVLEIRTNDVSPDVARLDQLPSSLVSLQMDLVNPEQNLAGELKRDDVAPRLYLTADELIQEQGRDDYEIAAELRFRYEVQL